MATAATFGKGTLLQREITPASSTFVTIAECKSIGGPTLEAEEVDVTSHDSSGDFREFIRGLVDAGEITTEINYIPDNATHATLFADLLAGTVRNYRIRWAQMVPIYILTFEAFVKSLPQASPVDNVLTATITLRLTGLPALAAE